MQFINVCDNNKVYYGGDQRWFRRNYMKRSACGVVACANIVACTGKAARSGMPASCGIIAIADSGDSSALNISMQDYMRLLKSISHYLPVIPKAGINGITLTIGLNIYFRMKGIHLKARWGTFPSRIFKEIERMLSQGIPVILAIGPGFPFLQKKGKLTLYSKVHSSNASCSKAANHCSSSSAISAGSDSTYIPASSAYAHYVTITGIDEQWLKVSSWGRCYYIKKAEYTDYCKKYSNFLFSNILVIH